MLQIYYLCDNQNFYLVSFVYGFLLSVLVVPFSKMFYGLAKRGQTENFLVLNEFFSFFGRLLVYVLALVFVKQIEIVFLIAAVAYCLFYFSARRIVV